MDAAGLINEDLGDDAGSLWGGRHLAVGAKAQMKFLLAIGVAVRRIHGRASGHVHAGVGLETVTV
jgi:beta-lactamase class D